MENTMDINTQQYNAEQIMIVDEISSTEIYIGTSDNSSDFSAANWKIKRILKTGSVWKFEFPDGNQEFKWVWSDKLTYSYK